MLDLRSRGYGFDFRCQVVRTWMGDCLQTSKPSRHPALRSTQPSIPPG